MYKSFRVQNFRGFKDLRLDDLARVNLIAGKNNTGKSALLEAILTYTGEYDSSILLRIFDETRRSSSIFGRDKGLGAIDPGWTTLFHRFETAEEICLSGQRDEHVTRNGYEGKTSKSERLVISIVNNDSFPQDISLHRTERERVVDADGPMLLFRDKYETRISFNPFSSRASSAYPIGERREPGRITKHDSSFLPTHQLPSVEKEAALFSVLRRTQQDEKLLTLAKNVEPRLTQVELLHNGPHIEVHGHINGLVQPLPLSSMGEGMRRIFSLMLAISTTGKGIVFIDEIENGLHHSIHVDVWRAIAEAASAYNVQIFATTHSYEMIRAAHEAFLDDEPYDFRLHRLDRSTKTNEIVPTTYNRFSMSAAIDLEAEVR